MGTWWEHAEKADGWWIVLNGIFVSRAAYFSPQLVSSCPRFPKTLTLSSMKVLYLGKVMGRAGWRATNTFTASS